MRRSFLLLFCVVSAEVLPGYALADQYDTWNVTGSASVIYDSNIFRLPDSASPAASLGQKSDFTTIASVGLKFDKPYAQQRFQLEISETAYRYANHSFLDFEALDYRGAWLWHLTPRISGILSADRKKTQIPFQDFRTTAIQQALRTTENRAFNADGWLNGPWHLLLGISQVQVQDSRMVTNERAYDAITQEFGIKYLAGSGNFLSLAQRRLQGDYQQGSLDPINFIDTGFREDQTELRAYWQANGLSGFTGRIAWIARQHEHFAQRDFEGVVGELTYTWVPTGKLRLIAAARRDLTTAWDQLRSSYASTSALSFTSAWQVTGHATVEMRYQWLDRNYYGELIPLASAARADTEHTAGLFLNWTPRRTVVMRAGLERYIRSSNVAQFEFAATICSLTASLMF